jgi:hypothetical protein
MSYVQFRTTVGILCPSIFQIILKVDIGVNMKSKKPVRNDEFQIETIDGELLLYHAGKDATLFLNETASIIWYLSEGERTVEEIGQMLVESYPENKEQVETDLQEAIQAYIDFGAMELQ